MNGICFANMCFSTLDEYFVCTKTVHCTPNYNNELKIMIHVVNKKHNSETEIDMVKCSY